MTAVVERRRRDKINTWISHLAELVPDCSTDIKLAEVSSHANVFLLKLQAFFVILVWLHLAYAEHLAIFSCSFFPPRSWWEWLIYYFVYLCVSVTDVFHLSPPLHTIVLPRDFWRAIKPLGWWTTSSLSLWMLWGEHVVGYSVPVDRVFIGVNLYCFVW